MYTQGAQYQTGAATTNYTTQQYNYQYQYQMPTTTKTTKTTTTQYVTQPVTTTTTTQDLFAQPLTSTTTTQDYFAQPVTATTSTQDYFAQPVTATTTTQDYFTQQPVTTTTTTQQFTTTQPVTYTQQISASPVYTQQQTYTTTAVPGYAASGFGVAQKPQPAFKLLRQGSGISPNEQQGIVSTAMAVYQSGITPISNNTASRIKKTLGGDWIVIVYAQGKPVDFNMTCVQGNDYMYFTLDNMAYQVCRLR